MNLPLSVGCHSQFTVHTEKHFLPPTNTTATQTQKGKNNNKSSKSLFFPRFFSVVALNFNATLTHACAFTVRITASFNTLITYSYTYCEQITWKIRVRIRHGAHHNTTKNTKCVKECWGVKPASLLFAPW